MKSIDNSDITGNKQQNAENTKFLSSEYSLKKNHKKLIKSPFELHNTTEQNKNQTRTQRYAENGVLKTELTSSASIKNCVALKNVSLLKTKESSKFCADKKALKSNCSESNFKYNKVSTKLESVSEIEETISTQSNNSNHENSSPLMYVDTNN